MRDGSDTNGDRLNISSIAECPPSRTSLLLTIPEAAAALRVNRSSIYRLFDSGKLLDATPEWDGTGEKDLPRRGRPTGGMQWPS